MKRILFIAFAFISFSVSAQNYKDSTITLQLTQRFANYVGQYARVTMSGDEIWKNRSFLDAIKPYIGSGAANKKDSLFSVNIKVIFVVGALDRLISQKSLKTAADMNSVVFNSPIIPSYTALGTQLTNIAAGVSSQKLIAQYILDWYTAQTTAQTNDATADYNATVQWSKLEP